ncbi:MAG: endolytic transglycosylase MltG [Parvularcula sp.]|jgi:UPF0755 protein|nr:endolytic transglycosylase MltG [Parvularcula sp.]
MALGQRGFLRVFLLLLLLLIGAAGYAAYEIDRRLSAEGAFDQSAVVWVQKGQSLKSVALELEQSGLVEDAELFYYYGRATGLAEGLRAGEFEIEANSSVKTIAETLREADPLLRFVTVPEGRTVSQALRIVSDAPVLEGEITITPDEGDLLPETYAYERGESRDAVIRRMMQAHDDLLAELWPGRAEDLPFDTAEEAVILASIVEKETAVPDERPQVAAVFVNRLRRGMRLQSDPTIIYGITGGEPLGRGIRQSELDNTENLYNTYRINGLPPTPIANPGRESIAAVLNPAQTNDLYFVADGTGGHVFASTLREHNQNVARWRRIEQSRKTQ